MKLFHEQTAEFHHPPLLPFWATGPSGRLIKEEYIHDCIQMDVPPGMPPQPDHQGAMKLPPPEHYSQPLPPLQLPPEPPCGPPPVTLYPNMPLSPTGKLSSRHGRENAAENVF